MFVSVLFSHYLLFGGFAKKDPLHHVLLKTFWADFGESYDDHMVFETHEADSSESLSFLESKGGGAN